MAPPRIHRVLASPRLKAFRRSLNSSRLLPGAVREAIGGRVYSSADYRVLAGPAELAALNGWRNPRVARRQLRSWQRRLASGEAEARPDVANLRSAVLAGVEAAGVDEPTVVETGCGSAYNRRILDTVLDRWWYVGVDFAYPMLEMAEEGSRGAVVQAVGEALPLGDSTADVVVDGGALIHFTDWRRAVGHMCRVARGAVVLHTVTVTRGAPTTLLAKRAYGYPVPEWVLNPDDLAGALAEGGFRVVRRWDGIEYDLDDVVGIPTASQTWLALPVQ